MFGRNKVMECYYDKIKDEKMDNAKQNEKAEIARIKQEKLDKELREAKEKDDAERIAAREFRPNVRIVQYDAGEFFCYDKTEVPRKFIEDISIEAMGEEPHFSYYRGVYAVQHISSAPASIKLTMSSGQTHMIQCSRHELDILFDAMTTAWKSGKPV